jgi:acyl-[acyl-carrier-protein]-phospholipid O-acyltransferase/long-chain-fatty-acid--[acyl-carrier-protein] ligase
MVTSMFATARVDTTLFEALVDARRQHGGGHVVADDLEMRPMTYNALITASYALGAALARRTHRGERVGVLLPTSRASLVTFFALQAERRVPAMLNFSTGATSACAACRAAEVAVVITARRFVDKAKLEPLVAALGCSGLDRVSRRHPPGDRPLAAAGGAAARRDHAAASCEGRCR